ncbi:MAG: ABC transporter ATP-binding protein [Desulfovibrionaceae bacterium]
MAADVPALACSGVEVRFGGVRALDGAGFEAAPGRISAVIGPNGAGKTTLLNAVTGMVEQQAGGIELFGRDITRLAPHERARDGVVRTFQNLEVFSNLSVLENVMTGCHARVRYSPLHGLLRTPKFWRAEARIRELAEQELEFAGLSELANDPAGDLPFGGQRLLELARALAGGPRLLLLDEPAAGLNIKETQSLGRLITRIRDERGVSIVLVEHDMDLVMHVSDQVAVLSFGKVIAAGTPREVQSNREVIKAYLGEEDDE